MFVINQAGQPEFNPLDPHGKRTETGKLFLTSTCMPWHIYAGLCKHMWTYKCNKILKNIQNCIGTSNKYSTYLFFLNIHNEKFFSTRAYYFQKTVQIGLFLKQDQSDTKDRRK